MENPRTTDIDCAVFDFPEDFVKYVKEKKLYCLYFLDNRCNFVLKWIFYSLEDDQREIPRGSFCDMQINTTMLELPVKTPIDNPEITQKLISLFQRLPLTRWAGCLIQFWKAIETGGRSLLTTRDQPFCLATAHKGVCSYRMMSLGYEFDVDGEGEENLGLPGRVFRYQRLEFIPDVCYYSCKEYPQLDGARQCNIKASLAFPVFETSTCNCVGVLELVGNETPDALDLSVFKADIYHNLKQVDLKSSGACKHLIGDKDEAVAEIDNVLHLVCETHDLPLAQVWAPCRFCNALVPFISFGAHKDKSVFFNLCKFHHLEKEQGIVGRAFSSHNFVFCEDITKFSIIKYPLVYCARALGLACCFAICWRNSFTGDDVYVTEVFLSPRNKEGGDLKTTSISLLAIMRQRFKRFKVAYGEELGEELPIDVIEISKDDKLDSFQTPQTSRSPDEPETLENGEKTIQLDSSYQQVMEVDVVCTGNNADGMREKSNVAITYSQQKCFINLSQRRDRKSGIPISLLDLEECFGMKLKVAAERLGVGRSTLKRACREYGITWWPSRKRNKDNHFLSYKSIQGATQEEFPDSNQPPISNPLRKQDMCTIATGTKPHSKAEQDTSNVTVKAKYGDDFIKFQLLVSSGMVEFQQQVAKS